MGNFLGCHAINMDAKGRIAIPAKVREELLQICGGRIVLTASANEEHCLFLYPEPEWAVIQPKVAALPNMNRRARRLQRLLLGNAAPMELDSAGRILIPQPLRNYAGLEKKLMLVGQGRKLEIWDEDQWFAWLNQSCDDEEMPPEMEALTL